MIQLWAVLMVAQAMASGMPSCLVTNNNYNNNDSTPDCDCASSSEIRVNRDNVVITVVGCTAIPQFAVYMNISNLTIHIKDVHCTQKACGGTAPWISASNVRITGLFVTLVNVTADMRSVDKGVAGLIHCVRLNLQDFSLLVDRCQIFTNSTPVVHVEGDSLANVSVQISNSTIAQQSTAYFIAKYGYINIECTQVCAHISVAVNSSTMHVNRTAIGRKNSSLKFPEDIVFSWRLIWITVPSETDVIYVMLRDSLINSTFTEMTAYKDDEQPLNVKFVVVLLVFSGESATTTTTTNVELRNITLSCYGSELTAVSVDTQSTFIGAGLLSIQVMNSKVTLVSPAYHVQNGPFKRSLAAIYVNGPYLRVDTNVSVSDVACLWQLHTPQRVVLNDSKSTIYAGAIMYVVTSSKRVSIAVSQWNLDVVSVSHSSSEGVAQPVLFLVNKDAVFFTVIIATVAVLASLANASICIDSCSVFSQLNLTWEVRRPQFVARVATSIVVTQNANIENAIIFVNNVSVKSRYLDTTAVLSGNATQAASVRIGTSIVDSVPLFFDTVQISNITVRHMTLVAVPTPTAVSANVFIFSAVVSLSPQVLSSNITLGSMHESVPRGTPFATILCAQSMCWIQASNITQVDFGNNNNNSGEVLGSLVVVVPKSTLFLSASKMHFSTSFLYLASPEPYSHVITGNFRIDENSTLKITECNFRYLTLNLFPLPTSVMQPFALRAIDLSLQYRDNPPKNVIIGCNVLNGAPLSKRRIGVPTWMLSHVPQYSQRLHVNCTAECWGNDESSTVSSTKYVSPELYPGVLPTEDAPDAPSSVSANAAVTVA
ncbi:Hypothetical protein, putative, partial [Bodo saltans]